MYLGVKEATGQQKPQRFTLPEKWKPCVKSGTNLEMLGNQKDFGELLPKLECVCLIRCTKATLLKWVVRSEIQSVKSLTINMVTENVPESSADNFKTLNDNQVSLINRAFQNLEQFVVSFHGNDLRGFKTIFVEMRNIRHLNLCLNYSGHVDGITAALLGIPVKQVKTMRNGTTAVNLNNRELPSIANMMSMLQTSITVE